MSPLLTSKGGTRALHVAALAGYVSVALLFSWPLPLHLGTALLGSPGGDTGVYVWNLWVFRHEIVSNGTLPFFTTEIISGTARAVPLTLHNYTTAANIVAFPLLPLLGIVATFNVLLLASTALSAYVMFLFIRERVQDDAAAWIGGLLFGFSPFMTARQMAHFSLVQAAALPAFALVLYRLRSGMPTVRQSIAGGAVVAWAFLSDPYYAVYCLILAVFFILSETFVVDGRTERAPFRFRAALDVAIMAFAGLVVAILVRGGGRIDFLGVRVSMTRLYTPVLVLTVLAGVRMWLTVRPRIGWRNRPLKGLIGAAVVGGTTCIVLLAPVLSAMGTHLGDGQWISPRIWWRSSAPGVDLLAYLVPNPVGTLFGWVASGWLARMPDGLYEHVAAIPWTATFAIAAALLYAGLRLPFYWSAFTLSMALLALGPFINIAGWNTHIPTPWALLRYLPVVGAARMPTRFTILLMLGVAGLLAFAVKALRQRSARPWVPTAVVGGLLLVELAPMPRELHMVQVPAFYRTIAEDPRDVKVLHLPFGLRDGLSSAGNFSAGTQFLQAFHEKPILGGYLSRLPRGGVRRYRRVGLLRVLLDLSEGLPVENGQLEAAIAGGRADTSRLKVGYVVIDPGRASPKLVNFAKSAMNLEWVATEGGQELYIVR